jgi:hypothetical protein
MRFKSRTAVIVGLIFLATILLPLFIAIYGDIYTDWLWFDSLGYLSVFRTRILASWGMFLAGGVVALAFLILNLVVVPPRLVEETDRVIRVNQKRVRIDIKSPRGILMVAAVLIAFVLGLRAAGEAMPFLRFRNAAPFGLADPIFGLDAGFYIFKLPFYQSLVGWATALLVLSLIGIGLFYLLTDSFQQRGPAAHLSVLGALLLLVILARYQLDRLSLLDSARGVVFGAGYTDVHARLPLLQIQSVIVILGATVLVVNVFFRRWRLFLLVAGAWLLVAVVGPVYPGVVQRFRVDPNELATERPYIEHNIAFTRYAFGLEDVEAFDFEGGGALNETVVEENEDTIRNIRLWDWRPLATTFEQIQELRLYYTFNDVDVDRYVIDGELREVMLAARELDVEQLPEQAQTWVNRHLIFTHGYGLCLNPVNEVTEEGLPNLLVRDIPPESADPSLEITQPAIYFGERTHNYVIINTEQQEFDRPRGDENVYTTYDGADGVTLGGLGRRLAFALRFSSQQIIFSGSINPESRILFHRTVSDRAQTLAPMFWYDHDPYLAIADGRLVWIYDAYTWTDRFPYSEPFWGDSNVGEINYVRNSVKVTIDAYTGETTFYVVDPDDPILQTYQAIFPDLFTPVTEMDPTVRAHWRYPEQFFRIQADAYASYHMEDPQVFYNKEDLWTTPSESYGAREQGRMAPYYVVMELPGSSEVEFIMMRPYVPNGRENMIAWLYADSDGDDYGQLGVYKFSKEELVYGPTQIAARFDQDAYISQQLTLWNQRGSEVIRGNLLVIPVDDTLLYVQPLYLQAQAGSIPELKRVLLAHGSRLVMAEDLATALGQVLSDEPVEVPPGEEPLPTDVASLVRSAQAHYEAAERCLQVGDWACYGRELDALASDLEALVEATEE